jgi:FMN-dependent NADH-azoreductase
MKKKVLYISASSRGEKSTSHQVANAFVAEYLRVNKTHTVDQLDLWSLNLPEMSELVIDAKYKILAGEVASQSEQNAWVPILELAKHFRSFDKYIFSIPMWNFSIPYKLKHYMDVIIQPSLTFSSNEQGEWTGLVVDRPAFVVYARGNAYTENTGFGSLDFQRPYMELLLNFIGIDKITTIVVEPTLENNRSVAVSINAAKRLAHHF